MTRAGSRFGRYELRSLLGRGGMGEVYIAYDTSKDRVVALKLLPPEFARNTGYEQRFRREAHAAARLQEPHVIPIHDWGEHDGVLYIDMRLVEGQDLRRLLVAQGPMPPRRAVAIVGQVASALDAAHAHGLVHRDVKPENILIGSRDFAYLVDFGIASDASDVALTTAGSTIGTYAYMAPERFDNEPVTGQADIYSLGCVLHEALTGSKPYPANTVSALVMAHLTATPPAASRIVPGIPPALDHVVARALAKNPQARYETAGRLARAAQDALEGRADPGPPPTAVRPPPTDPTVVRPVPSYTPTPPPYYPPPAPPQRSSMVPVLITLLVVALLGLGGVVVWLLTQNRNDDVTTADRTTVIPTAAITTEAVTPATTSTTTTTTPAPAPLVGSVSGADGQGFLPPSGPRCNSTNLAMTIGRTSQSQVVICQTAVGRYYYEGMRLSDGAAISLDDPVPGPGGSFTVVNPTDGTRYQVTASALTIVDGSGDVAANEPMVEFAHR
ncbi:MAG TPA: serine/threonine-protein kinase [Aldersonia sp.]